MELSVISRIINEWDPIDLFPAAPKDEYDGEINKISSFITNNKIITSLKLANIIHDVFIESFGENIFKSSIDECLNVANKLLSNMNK
ncbi:MAG TPA: DUF1871 family protein [Clostridia bacterium]